MEDHQSKGQAEMGSGEHAKIDATWTAAEVGPFQLSLPSDFRLGPVHSEAKGHQLIAFTGEVTCTFVFLVDAGTLAGQERFMQQWLEKSAEDSVSSIEIGAYDLSYEGLTAADGGSAVVAIAAICQKPADRADLAGVVLESSGPIPPDLVSLCAHASSGAMIRRRLHLAPGPKAS